VLHTGADIGRAREALGYEPSTSLEDGLRAEFEWALSARPAAIPSAAARS
jgi:nucleoside-diphosphate-sugar epimerase